MRKRSTNFVHTASGVKFTQQDLDRFWGKVDRKSPEECWPICTRSKRGYGTFYVDGQDIGSHRVAYLVARGDIPDGLHILHNCDNPSCCNPSHLRTGTHQENIQDRVDRDRGNPPKGEECRWAKLTEEDVLEIRRRYTTGAYLQVELAAEFGCSAPHIGHVVNHNLWKHVGGEPRENRHLPPSRKKEPIVVPPRAPRWKQRIRNAFYAPRQPDAPIHVSS